MTDMNPDLLLVESYPRDVELTLYALRQHPLAGAIRVASDGAEALECLLGAADGSAADTFSPKAILLDLWLRKVDGLGVLQRIRSEARTRDVPVFVLVSSHFERSIVERHALAVSGYILKPVDLDKFTKAMRSVGLS